MADVEAAHRVEVGDVLQSHFATPASAWSIGTFGAIAEFARDEGEPALRNGAWEIATQRGAMRLTPVPGIRPVAHEQAGKRRERWTHEVAFCLPAREARMSARAVLTEAGPDRTAIRPDDRGHILFDIGAGASNVDVFIRVGDADFIAYLRANAGRSIVGRDCDVMRRIVKTHPHRVFESRLGRIEVYQRIGSDDAVPPTPEGPHTHVLPAILERRRTHAATLPIPPGMTPCLTLYPAHPVAESHGHADAFDRDAFAAFQELYRRWGDEESIAAKDAAFRAVRRREAPDGFSVQGRHARAAVRVALRQLAYLDAEEAVLDDWRRVWDPPRNGKGVDPSH